MVSLSKKVSNLAVPPFDPLNAAAYWDAMSSKLPPQLSTTFGNFTCVNSVARFSFTTQPNYYTQFLIGYSPSAVRVQYWDSPDLSTAVTGGPLGVWQQQQLNANNTVPLDVRPLRSSFRMKNTTQALNVAGSITAVLVPQSVTTIVGSLYGSITGRPVVLDNSCRPQLWSLAENSPSARTISGAELKKSHTFVTPPSSFIAYNSYSDWIPLTAASDGGALAVADWRALTGTTGSTLTFPYSDPNNWLGAIPPNYILVINIEPNPLAQTFEMESFCQDGVRYPAYSMAASAAQTHLTHETLTEHQTQTSVVNAADAFVQPTDSVSQVGTMIEHLAANAGSIGTIVSGVAPVVGAVIGSRFGNPMRGASIASSLASMAIGSSGSGSKYSRLIR